MTRTPRPRVALVSSGLSTGSGGVGVVSEHIWRALEGRATLSLWLNRRGRPRAARIAALAARAARDVVGRLDFVVYEHVDLARLHVALPFLRRVPFGIFLHGTEVWVPATPLRRLALCEAEILWSNSRFTEKVARAANPWLPCVEVTWLGARRPQEPRDFTARPPTAIIVGRMKASERRKGHDAILDGWPKVLSAVPEAKLTIVGDGDDLPRLRERVARQAIPGVKFTGWLADHQRDAEYGRSRLFVLPSLQEGFGLVAIEAALAGLPILGLRGTVMEEIFPEGAGAVLASSATGDAIAEAAIPVLADIEAARALGARARAEAETRFLVDHFTERFRATLRERSIIA